jgi:hypothetical protein
MTSPSPKLTKTVWDQNDYEMMGWHDNTIHALALEPARPHPGQVWFDIDYIVEWLSPSPPDTAFQFSVAPASLIFPEAWDLELTMDLRHTGFEVQISSIERTERQGSHRSYFDWTITGDGLQITFSAPGFNQYIRQPPRLSSSQRLTLEERGGISFDHRQSARP